MTISPARLGSEAGFTLFEMLVSTGLIVLITSGVFSLLNPSYGTFQVQPEVSDMQQRLRVAADTVQKDLVMAGAGTYSGPMVGTLDNYFAPILPHEVGTVSPEPAGTFRANPLCPTRCASAITIMYVPNTNSQTTIRDDMPTPSAELKVDQQPGCGEDERDLCGFNDGDRVLIFDPAAPTTYSRSPTCRTARCTCSIATTSSRRVLRRRLDHESGVAHLLPERGASDQHLRAPALQRLPVRPAGHRQRRRLPHRVLRRPAAARIVRPVSDPTGPWTTYGPKPPTIGTDNDKDPWGTGENCVFHVDGASGRQVARPQIQTLGTALDGPVPLTDGMLTDGPWCPSATNLSGDAMPNKFDADLLRVRQVRVTLRVQAANEVLRGPAGTLFRHGGRSRGAERFIPDQEVRFDVSPRNMNLGR